MTSPTSAMIFAAGFGTRMGDLTRSCPKPLIKVAGRTLLDQALDLARAGGAETLVVNTHYLSQQIADHLAGTDVLVSHEAEILDTGGGLRAALPLLGPDPVFTMNADVVWQGPNPLACLAEAWDPDTMDALLLCVPLAQTVGRKGGGDFTLHPDRTFTRGGDHVYTGVQILKTDLLAEIPEHVFSLNLLWNQMVEQGRARALDYPGRWCDVGHPDGIELAETLLKQDDI